MQATKRIAVAVAGVAAVAVGSNWAAPGASTVHRSIDPVVLTGS